MEEGVLNFEIGECDTCLEENKKVIVCSSNNKCNYKMCSNCMSELRLITKTNLCPNCRETKKEIDLAEDDIIMPIYIPSPPPIRRTEITLDTIDSESDEDEDEHEDNIVRETKCQRFAKGCVLTKHCCICEMVHCVLDSILCCTIGYYDCVYSCYDIESLNIHRKRKKIIVLSTMILLLIVALLMGSIAFTIMTGINPLAHITTNFFIFLWQSLVGVIIITLFIMALALVALCLCDCSHEENTYG